MNGLMCPLSAAERREQDCGAFYDALSRMLSPAFAVGTERDRIVVERSICTSARRFRYEIGLEDAASAVAHARGRERVHDRAGEFAAAVYFDTVVAAWLEHVPPTPTRDLHALDDVCSLTADEVKYLEYSGQLFNVIEGWRKRKRSQDDGWRLCYNPEKKCIDARGKGG